MRTNPLPVLLLAAVDANLRKSEGGKETNVPGDHQKPELFKLKEGKKQISDHHLSAQIEFEVTMFLILMNTSEASLKIYLCHSLKTILFKRTLNPPCQ